MEMAAMSAAEVTAVRFIDRAKSLIESPAALRRVNLVAGGLLILVAVVIAAFGP